MVLFISLRSCQIFQKFSDSLAHIVRAHTQCDLDWYLDDFFFVDFPAMSCDQQVRIFLNVCEQINFPVAPEKTVWGSVIIEFLGLIIDTIRQLILIPDEKVSKAVSAIDRIVRSKKVKVRDVQELTGLLNFLTKAIVPGRTFTRRMYAKFSGMRQYHHIRVDRELKMDCFMWDEFLSDQSNVARPFVDFSEHLTATNITLTTDASLNQSMGFAGYFHHPRVNDGRGQWFSQSWPAGFIKKSNCSIEVAELIGSCTAVLLWARHFRNKRVVIWCDNQAVMHMINKATAKCAKCMFLLRIITATCMKFNCRVFCKYISSKNNRFADLLSRNKTDMFLREAPHTTSRVPLALPQVIWPFPQILWMA